jgi:hypothetical protein
LTAAQRVQDEVYGVRPVDLSEEEWSASLQKNFLCAHTELSEALQEMPWKEWRGPVGRPDFDARDLAIVEIIDALCHISNILNLLGVDDLELNDRYAKKVGYTRERDRGVS